MEILDTRTAIRHLGEHLACEYSGAMPAGRVLGMVTVTAHRLRRVGYRGADLVELTETTSRSELTRRVGQAIARNRVQPARLARAERWLLDDQRNRSEVSRSVAEVAPTDPGDTTCQQDRRESPEDE